VAPTEEDVNMMRFIAAALTVVIGVAVAEVFDPSTTQVVAFAIVALFVILGGTFLAMKFEERLIEGPELDREIRTEAGAKFLDFSIPLESAATKRFVDRPIYGEPSCSLDEIEEQELLDLIN
jgi:hypothetical protein